MLHSPSFRACLVALTMTTNFFVALPAAAISGWTHVGPATLGRDIVALAASPSRFVALTDATGLLWSDDGVTWTHATAVQPTHHMFQVAYGNGVFVAVGNGALRSTDGITWTYHRVPLSQFTALGFNGTRFIAADNASGTVKTSTDGATWTAVNGGPAAQGMAAYVTVGNGITLVYGFGSTMARSADGVIWQSLSTPVLGGRAFWDGTQFVFGGATGPYYGSPDGATWTLLVGYSTEVPLATATLGAATFYLYDDRVDHGSGAATPGGGVTATSPEILRTIAATSSRVIAAGEVGAWFSYQNAIGWQQLGGDGATNGDEGPLVSVELGGAVLAWTRGNVTVGGSLSGLGQISFSPAHLLRSVDGVTWTSPVVAAPPAPGAGLGNMVVFGGLIYTVSADRLYSSADGLSWTDVATFPWPLATIATDGTTLVVSGAITTEMGIASSTDATSWSTYTFASANAVPFLPVQIVKTHLGWWAFCTDTGVWKSNDAITWNHFSPVGIGGVGAASAANNRIWFTARNSGLTRWTADGVNWIQSSFYMRFLQAPQWDGSRWFAVATDFNGPGNGPEHLATVYESDDGDAWHVVRGTEFADPRFIHVGAEGSFVLGAGGTVLRRTSLEPLVAQIPRDNVGFVLITTSTSGSLATISGAPPGATHHIVYDSLARVSVTLDEATGNYTIGNLPVQNASGYFDYYVDYGGRQSNRGRFNYQLQVATPPPSGGGGGGAVDPLLALAFGALALLRRRRCATV